MNFAKLDGCSSNSQPAQAQAPQQQTQAQAPQQAPQPAQNNNVNYDDDIPF